MKNKQITSIEGIEKEQKKLKLTMDLTKESFFKNISTNQEQLKKLLVNKVAIPGGLAGLGYAAFKSLTKLAGKPSVQSNMRSSSRISEKVLPLAISMAQAYFFKQWKKKETKEGSPTHPTGKKYTNHPLKKVG